MLFEEMAQLMRYRTPQLNEFPYTISFDDEVAKYVDPNNSRVHKEREE